MKKKILVLCLCVILAAIAIVAGTMAYFTDTAVTNASVIQVGNVDIKWQSIQWLDANNQELHKWERPADGESPFESDNDLKLMPGVSYTANLKLKNDGSNAAYLRVRVRFAKNAALIEQGQDQNKEVFQVGFESAQLAADNDYSVSQDLEDDEYVYYTITFTNPIPADTVITMDAKIGLNPDLNNSEVSAVFNQDDRENAIDMEFVAEAIQTTGFSDVGSAFDDFESKLTTNFSETTTVETVTN